MHRYIAMAGGALTAISVFLPFTSVMGISVNGLKMGGVAWFYIAVGIAFIAIGYLNKRSLYFTGAAVGLLVGLLAMNYMADVRVLSDASAGIGLWCLFIGGLTGCIGSVIGVVKTRKNVTALM